MRVCKQACHDREYHPTRIYDSHPRPPDPIFRIFSI
jgi:hypothetical protein